MPIERSEGEFSHIQFKRVPDLQLDRRTRRPPPSRVKAPGDRVTHAQAINVGFTQTDEEVAETRRRIGIDPSRLFVLEFNSLNLDLREIIERYQTWVVEEYSRKSGEDENYRFLVQFPTETSRQLFLDDLQLYLIASEDSATLPPGMRRNFFDLFNSPSASPLVMSGWVFDSDKKDYLSKNLSILTLIFGIHPVMRKPKSYEIKFAHSAVIWVAVWLKRYVPQAFC